MEIYFWKNINILSHLQRSGVLTNIISLLSEEGRCGGENLAVQCLIRYILNNQIIMMKILTCFVTFAEKFNWTSKTTALLDLTPPPPPLKVHQQNRAEVFIAEPRLAECP